MNPTTEFGNFQKGILSDLTHGAAYVTIFLTEAFMKSPSGSAQDLAVRHVCSSFANLIQGLNKTHLGESSETDRDKAGLVGIIGFGPNLTRRWIKNTPKSLRDYVELKGAEEYSFFPSTGGDIFLHLKSNRRDLLFLAAKNVVDQLGQIKLSNGSSVLGNVEQVDGYSYLVDKYGMARDMTGFEDGTKNPKTLKAKLDAALIPKAEAKNGEAGGSFLLTQRWIHNLNDFNRLPVPDQEKVFGRTKPDSEKLKENPSSSHVSLTELSPENGKKREILRHSMPYGTATEHGLFFLAYSSDTDKIDIMLRQMTHASKINPHLDMMKYTKCVSGQYFYVPNEEQLAQLGVQSKL